MTPEQIEELNQRIDAAHACPHGRTELRVLVKSNGTQEVRRQCLRCGAMVEAVKLRTLPRGQLARLQAWDAALRDRWSETVNGARQAAFRAVREQEQHAWWMDYTSYLRTPEWARKRRQVLDRDGWLCQECHAPAEHIHHLTYKHRGEERLYELVSLCFDCHDAEHDGALSRGDRRTEEG